MKQIETAVNNPSPIWKRGRIGRKLPGFFLCAISSCLLMTPVSLSAQSVRAPVNLGTAGNYVILSQTGITDVPPSAIAGNIGASPITGAAIHLTCTEVTGTISAVDAAGPAPCSLIVPGPLGVAINDMTTAFTDAAGRTTPDFVNLGAGNITGLTLAPGLYKWGTDVLVSAGGVTLSGGPNAVWIFQIAGDLNVANNAHIMLAGGAQANNIFWQVGASNFGAVLGTGSVMNGTILSAAQVIENTGATLIGRALARTQVTLQSTSVTSPGSLINGVPPPVGPTVTSTIPFNLSTGVPVGNALSAAFSEAMNPATINAATFSLRNGATTLSGSVAYTGITATFTPSVTLPANTLLTATITTGAQDPAGVALAANYVWTFTTGAAQNLTPPTVSSTVPAINATSVPVGNALSATFSEALNPLTINAATFTLKQGAASVAGTVSYSGVTALFTPTGNLAPNVPFTATITTGVQDLSGNALAANYVWTFTSGAAQNLTPPTVSSTVPAIAATNVPVGNALSATFSEALNPLTVNTTTFTVKQGATSVAGTVNYSGITATFTPASSLAPNALFTATITTGVQDLSGNALATNYVWTFTTGSATNITPPIVSSTMPANGAANVPVGNVLAATFSEAVNPLTISTATFTLKQGLTSVPGTVSYSGVAAVFTPAASLAANTLYTATITTGIADLSGNALAANYVWIFTTGSVQNLTPPMVSSTVPAINTTSVPVGNALSATFSEAMNPLTINTTTFTLNQGGTIVAGTVNYSGVTATFTPASSLAPNAVFTATITTGVQDLSGNALAANYVWSFATGAVLNKTPPTVISTYPNSGMAGVPLLNNLSATFSEAINPLTINTATFTLLQGNVPAPGTVSYAGVTAVFAPAGNLAPNTVYTATITTGVTDLSGNTLATNYTWSFTTMGSVVVNPTLPVVISTTPPSGATAVTTSTNVTATFSEPMNPLTISTATFYVQSGTMPIPGVVTYSGVSATFRPIANLTPNTLYTAQIESPVADLSGNTLGSTYTWTFTTGASGDQLPVCLANFAVLAGFAVSNSGSTVITGDVGVTPGTAVTGFPPGTINGGTYTGGNANVSQAMVAITAAFADAAGRSVGPVSVSGDLGGLTLTPGIYKSTSALQIQSGNLTLDAKGNVNAVFLFQTASTFTTASGNQVILAGGAQAFNVFWQVGVSATLGANSVLNGSILAGQAITLNTGAAVNGRLAAIAGVVTLQNNVIISPAPFIAFGGVLNAASYSSSVAAGSIVSVFGNNFGSATLAATSYPLLPSLGQTSFQVGGQPGPLFMTSCSQANLQIPWQSAGLTSDPVIATVAGLVSPTQTANIVPFSPGIFTMNQSGSGQGAVEIAGTAQLAGPAGPGSAPVPRGQYIAIYCTGLGPVSNQPATGGAALSSPLSYTSVLPTVTIGGVAAQVTFSGLTPGLAGLYQVNALVPAAVSPGSAVSLVIGISGISSNSVTIAVQ